MTRLVLALIVALAAFSAAQAKPKVVSKRAAVSVTAHRRLPYVGAVSIDAATSNVLSGVDVEAEAYPASVTKLMTALLVLEDVKAGRYALTDMVEATPDAYLSEPSWVGIKAGEKMSVNDLLLALMVESANDAAIVLAVNSAGSTAAFVERMNSRARELGMSRTAYYNPNGLPPNSGRRYPWKKFNSTTAGDQAKLALCLVNDNPKILDYTSVKTCDLVKTIDGYRISITRSSKYRTVRETVLQAGEKVVKAFKNHNNVMRTDKYKIVNPDGSEAIDGLKTGYIDAGGSSIVITGTRNGKRAIAVVLGSANSEARDNAAHGLMVDALGALSW